MHQKILTGLEVFKQKPPKELGQKRLGLLANPASLDRSFTHGAKIIQRLFPGRLTALFSPQHGFYADKQDNMIESGHGIEPKLGIPIYSLYSETRIPKQEMFDQIDTLIIDIQDVGTRVYTFIYTISYCLEVAGRMGIPVIILDRPNPIGGRLLEGNVLEQAYSSFVGRFPIPMRHAMTVGEISLFFNQEFNLGCDLRVIPMEGWKRGMLWHDTGLAWIPPSPNLPTPLSCMVYPGQVIFEGTNISEGRGTTLPFEQFGAPFLDIERIMEKAGDRISGAVLRKIHFEPTSGKWSNLACKGFHIHVTDPEAFRPYFTSILILQIIMEIHPDEFRLKEPPYEYEYRRTPLDLILGSRRLREKIQDLEPVEGLENQWVDELADFSERSGRYYLYG